MPRKNFDFLRFLKCICDQYKALNYNLKEKIFTN